MLSKAREIWEASPDVETDTALIDRATDVATASGDVPEPIWYEAMMRAADKPRVAKALQALRPDGAKPYRGRRD